MRDLTELGSGFKIAMRDLPDSRGAGNLLGKQRFMDLSIRPDSIYILNCVKPRWRNKEKEVQVWRKKPSKIRLTDWCVPSFKLYSRRTSKKIEMYKRIRSIDSIGSLWCLMTLSTARRLPRWSQRVMKVGWLSITLTRLTSYRLKRKDRFGDDYNCTSVRLACKECQSLKRLAQWNYQRSGQQGRKCFVLLNITKACWLMAWAS